MKKLVKKSSKKTVQAFSPINCPCGVCGGYNDKVGGQVDLKKIRKL